MCNEMINLTDYDFLKSAAKIEKKSDIRKRTRFFFKKKSVPVWERSWRCLYFAGFSTLDAALVMRYAVAKGQKTGRKWRMFLYSP